MASAWFPNGPDDPDATLLALTPTSAEIWDGPSSSVLVAFKLATAKILGKSEDYVQVIVSDGAVATFAGKRVDDSAFVRVYSIGEYKPDACKKLSAEYAALFQKAGIAPERLYINFCVQTGPNWGWNGTTF